MLNFTQSGNRIVSCWGGSKKKEKNTETLSTVLEAQKYIQDQRDQLRAATKSPSCPTGTKSSSDFTPPNQKLFLKEKLRCKVIDWRKERHVTERSVEQKKKTQISTHVPYNNYTV